MPIKSIIGVQQIASTKNHQHIKQRFERGTTAFVDKVVCTVAELQFMLFSRGTYSPLHFDRFRPFVYTATTMHIFTALITNPVHGLGFLLATYKGQQGLLVQLVGSAGKLLVIDGAGGRAQTGFAFLDVPG